MKSFGDEYIIEGGDDNAANIWNWENGRLEKFLNDFNF